jgi:hypothetical protein
MRIIVYHKPRWDCCGLKQDGNAWYTNFFIEKCVQYELFSDHLQIGEDNFHVK